MIKVKTVLQSTQSAGEYLAPSVKVKELRERRVLCASFTQSTENMDEESTDNFFN